tara:strand:+ start:455 stop:787 length:333 start_codon:yes stop_codon:yes gene_type:complete
MNKKEFFFNPDNPKKSFDVYKDKNPKDTIPIKYSTLKETKETIKKLEKLYKDGKYPHNRISKVAMILMVRLRVINPDDKRTKLAIRYFEFLKDRTKEKDEKKRKKLKFKI